MIGTGTATIQIQGTGGVGGDNNVGVKISGSSTVSVEDGDITDGFGLRIVGRGGTGSGNNNYGAVIENATLSSSGTGGILVQGIAGGTGTSGIGLYGNRANILATGTGNIWLAGVGSGSSDGSGVVLVYSNVRQTGGTTVTIQGIGSRSTTGNGQTGFTMIGGLLDAATLQLIGVGGAGTQRIVPLS